MLHQGQAGGRVKVSVLLFFEGVWCMIGGNHVNHTVFHRLNERLLMVRFFDGGITFDQCAFAVVVVAIKKQVMNAGFGSDLLLLQGL